jgi:uncharacterized SAM-binding protein YcdF (DUF218 family)
MKQIERLGFPNQLRQGRSYLFPLAVTAIITLVFLTSASWLPKISSFLIVTDRLQPADAIVPLAGGLERASYAAVLFREDYASWFIVTDSNTAQSTIQNIGYSIIEIALAEGVPHDKLRMIATPVSSTYEEALAVRELAQSEGWQSLIVVTSPSHTRRSRMIFRNIFANTEIKVIICPVDNDRHYSEQWWQDPESRKQVFLEYLKIGGFLIARR